MINLDVYELSDRYYDGMACRKLGLKHNGKYYLLKFPNKIRGMKNVNISYANDVYSEYIASHVAAHYIPAHEVQLGLRDGKVCALCTDFCGDTGRLYTYTDLKTTIQREVLRPNGELSNGEDPELEAVSIILTESNAFSKVHDVDNKFWTMFILDALNGNPDRNNRNWGVVIDDGVVSFAPVYDNGNSLNSKYSDEQLAECLVDTGRMKALAYSGFRCFFTEDDKRINPFHYIESGTSKTATEVLRKLDLSFDPSPIIDSLEISQVRKDFYKEMYKLRYAEMRRIRDSLCEELSEDEKMAWDMLPKTIKNNYTGSKRQLLKELDLLH